VQKIDHLLPRARSQAHVERSILTTGARGMTSRNYNSNTSIALIHCCVPTSPAFVSSFLSRRPRRPRTYPLSPTSCQRERPGILRTRRGGGTVKAIMERLMKIPEAQSLLNQCNEIEFENHLNTFERQCRGGIGTSEEITDRLGLLFSATFMATAASFSLESTKQRTNCPSNIYGPAFVR
jgi:hypothetical protein